MAASFKSKVTLSMLIIITLVGFSSLVYQLINGLGVSGMNNVVSWGLYITFFMFFVGLSAGGLIVSSSATVFNIPAFKVVAKPAVILSIVCITIAGLFIVIDIGSPERMLNLLLYPNFDSPLIWDVIVIGLYFLINVIYLYLMTRKEVNEKSVKIMSTIALPVAILVHSVTAWIFGLQIAKESWYSAIMAPLFVASALDSGLALLIIVLLLLSIFKVIKIEYKLITSLAGLLVIFVLVDAYLLFSEVLTLLWPSDGTNTFLNELTTGNLSLFFWGEVILGLLIPFLILIFRKNRENMKLVVLSSVLIIIGVLFKRIWLLFSAYLQPNVFGGAGVTTGKLVDSQDPTTLPNIWMNYGSYTPTLIEGSIILGVLSFGVLLFIFLAQKILVNSEEKNKLNDRTLTEKSVG